MMIYIKHMVSLRCKMLVESEIAQLAIPDATVELGKVIFKDDVASEKIEQLKTALDRSGLQVIDDAQSILVERIKNVILTLVHDSSELPNINLSEIISSKLKLDYTYLSNVFSKVSGYSIQHYLIVQRIERVKELMLYNEMNLSEIAFDTHFSSLAHLSAQFKKITGHSPSAYRRMHMKRTFNLEDV